MALPAGLVAAFKFVAWLVASFVVGKVIEAMTPQRRRQLEGEDLSHLSNQMSTDATLPLIYGPCRVGINTCFRTSTGSDNNYRHAILELGEGPIEGLYREDGSIFSSTGTAIPSVNPVLLYLDGELWTKWGPDYVYCEFFRGSADQGVCQTLKSAVPEWNHPKRHTPYLYLRLKYNMDKWLGVPEATVQVAGLRLFHPTRNLVKHSDDFSQGEWGKVRTSITPNATPAPDGFADLLVEDGSTNTHYVNQFVDFIQGEPFTVSVYSKTAGRNLGIYSYDPAGTWAAAVFDLTAGTVLSLTGGYTATIVAAANGFFRCSFSGTAGSGAQTPLILYQLHHPTSGASYAGNGTSGVYLWGAQFEIGALTAYSKTDGQDRIRYSTNFALAAYDMLTRPPQRGGLGLDAWHGPVPEAPRVPVDSVTAAAAYCEAKDWKGGMVLKDDLNFADHFNTILACFRGEMLYSEATYKLRFRDLNFESPVFDVSEADIVSEGGRTSLRIGPVADLYDSVNALEIEFYNQALNWQLDKHLMADTDAISTEAGMRRQSVKLLGLNTIDKVQQMGAYHLERARWGHRVSASLRDAFLAYEAMDYGHLTHNMPGWQDRPVRIVSTGYDPTSSTIVVEFEEEDLHLYDDVYDPALLPIYTTSIIDPMADPPSVINISIVEELAPTRLRSATRLVLTFDAPANYPWFDGVQIWLRVGASGTWQYMTKSSTGYVLEGVEEGQEYFFRLQTTNIWGRREYPENAPVVSRIVTGMASAPPSLAGMTAIANGDSVAIYATPPPNADDIDGYEVRLGAAWVGGIFMDFAKAPSLRLNGVRPGLHTFWMAAKSNNGLYATTPVSATVRVFILPGYTSAHAAYWNYSAGTFVNMQQDTYAGGPVLRCSHTSNVLTGTWTSPTFDMGSIKIVRCWGDFLTVFLSSTGTWEVIFPSSLTWEAVLAPGERWSTIFAPSAAANLRAELQHSANNVDWELVERFEILSAEASARYLRVKVTITDPTPDDYLLLHPLTMDIYTGAQ